MVLASRPNYGAAVRSSLCMVATLASCVGGLGSVSAEPTDPYVGSAAERVTARAGFTVVRRLRADLTGDGAPDEVVVLSHDARPGLRLVILSYAGGDAEKDPSVFRRVYLEDLPDAQRIVRLDAQPVAADVAPDLVAVFETPSPDERLVTVRLIGAHRGDVRALWRQTFINSAVQDSSVRRFGDARPHFVLDDVDQDGQSEVIWTLGPARLTVKGPEGPATFVIGARRRVLGFDAKTGTFDASAPEQVADFLPARSPSEVVASRQAPKIWGTAQAFWGADGDLETSWNLSRKGAAGQSLTLRFETSPTVSMIRVVPGCGGSRDDWARHLTIDRFRIQLSTGLRFDVHANGKGPWPADVSGIGVFPLEGNFGRQILVFLAEPSALAWGRLEVLRLGRPSGRRGRARIKEACLSEISFH